jgi:hypothetical protein
MVKQRGGKFVVLSEAGKKLGEFATEKEANERLRQIEAAKAAKDTDIPVEDGTGFIRSDARLTRTGGFRYADKDGNEWGELRTEDEVFSADALRSFEMRVVTNDHPDDFVSHRNVKDVSIGLTGSDVHKDGDFVVSSVLITDADAIQSVKDGKVELSCGYTAQVKVERGVTDDGTPYNGRQTNIRGNHVALVDRGRAGPDCKLLVGRGDAFTTLTQGEPMKTKKIKIGDKEYELPIETADAILAERGDAVEVEIGGKTITMSKDAAAHLETVKDQFPPKPMKGKGKEEPEDEEDKDSLSTLKAQADANEAELKRMRDTEPTRIDARVKIVRAVEDICSEVEDGKRVVPKTDGVGDVALMRKVTLKVSPDLKDKLDEHKDDVGYLRASFDAALRIHAQRKDAMDDTNAAIFSTHLNGGKEDGDDPIKSYDAYIAARSGNPCARKESEVA